MAKRLLCIFMFLILSVGCKSLGQYKFTPYSGIKMSINFKRFDPAKGDKIAFLYFNLQIKNTSEENFDFNPGQIQAEVNGKLSEATYYSSLASVLPEKKPLEKGKSEYKLYFVFPKDVIIDRVAEFKLIENGLSRRQD
jgi:hypothetical protein